MFVWILFDQLHEFHEFSSWVHSDFNPWHFCLGVAVQTAVLNPSERRALFKMEPKAAEIGTPFRKSSHPEIIPIFFLDCRTWLWLCLAVLETELFGRCK